MIDLPCPECGLPLEVDSWLTPEDQRQYTILWDGHEDCWAGKAKAERQLRALLKKPQEPQHRAGPPLPKTDRRVINKRNRYNGSTAQTEWARKIHGRNVGVLGREDVDDGIRVWEVKARRMPKWIRDAFVQVNKHPGDKLRMVVVRHPGKQGQPVEWWVIQRAEQYIDTNGLGLFEPEEPKRRMRR